MSKTDWTGADDVESVRAADVAFHTGVSHQQVCQTYAEWVKDGKYMKDTDPERYRAHIYACDKLEDFFPNNKDRIRAIDIGAGTGRAGSELAKKGFKNMDALEPSPEMLEEAKKLGIYTNFYNIPIGFDRLPIEDNTYDLLVCSGAMGEGHIPKEALHEMARIVKPGGIISIAMRKEFLDLVAGFKGQLEPLMTKMEKDGEWKMLSREQREHYFVERPGMVYRFSAC